MELSVLIDPTLKNLSVIFIVIPNQIKVWGLLTKGQGLMLSLKMKKKLN